MAGVKEVMSWVKVDNGYGLVPRFLLHNLLPTQPWNLEHNLSIRLFYPIYVLSTGGQPLNPKLDTTLFITPKHPSA